MKRPEAIRTASYQIRFVGANPRKLTNWSPYQIGCARCGTYLLTGQGETTVDGVSKLKALAEEAISQHVCDATHAAVEGGEGER
jgi:hypothetical protein